jgi:hypothetical protein
MRSSLGGNRPAPHLLIKSALKPLCSLECSNGCQTFECLAQKSIDWAPRHRLESFGLSVIGSLNKDVITIVSSVPIMGLFLVQRRRVVLIGGHAQLTLRCGGRRSGSGRRRQAVAGEGESQTHSRIRPVARCPGMRPHTAQAPKHTIDQLDADARVSLQSCPQRLIIHAINTNQDNRRETGRLTAAKSKIVEGRRSST